MGISEFTQHTCWKALLKSRTFRAHKLLEVDNSSEDAGWSHTVRQACFLPACVLAECVVYPTTLFLTFPHSHFVFTSQHQEVATTSSMETFLLSVQTHASQNLFGAVPLKDVLVKWFQIMLLISHYNVSMTQFYGKSTLFSFKEIIML